MGSKTTLADLWRRGTDLTVTGPEGSVKVWVQKLSPADQDEAYKRGQARRAVVLSAGRDKESDEYLAALGESYDLGPDFIVDLLIAEDVKARTEQIEAELGAAKEWSEEDYLAGLRKAWEGGLLEAWLDEDNDDPEPDRVFAEITRFAGQVDERVVKVREEMRAEKRQMTDDELFEAGAKGKIKEQANMAFYREYERCKMWMGVRRPEDHAKHYFASRAAVNDIGEEVDLTLRDAFNALEIGVTEGKDSPGSPASSPSSEPSERAETPDSSGLAVASQ